MRVAAYVNGLTDGFNTPGGSEAHYVYALVKVFSKYGHQVDCFGTGGGYFDVPKWGNSQPLPGVTLLNFYTGKTEDYDLYINMPRGISSPSGQFFTCIETRIKAKLNIHCSWAWSYKQEAAAAVQCWEAPHNHLIALPYNIKQAPSNPSLRYVPYPYYDFFTSVDPTARKGIFWGARHVFTDEWEEDLDRVVCAANLIKAMEIVSNKNNIPCYFLHGYTFETKRAKRLGVTASFNNIKNRKVYTKLVPKNLVIDMLNLSRVSPIPPRAMGSCVDALVHGCLPIFYNIDPPFEDYCEEAFHYIKKMFQSNFSFRNNFSPQELAEILEKICLDDKLYLKLVEQSRAGLSWHSYENSYKHIIQLVD